MLKSIARQCFSRKLGKAIPKHQRQHSQKGETDEVPSSKPETVDVCAVLVYNEIIVFLE
jgi:hypothetical protein